MTQTDRLALRSYDPVSQVGDDKTAEAPPRFTPVTKAPLAPLPDREVWVFGYGSLMWNPGFPFEELRPARLYGFHRSFCLYSHHYRGTPERPGLVLGLDRGGSCRGLAYRIAPGRREEVLDYLHRREMLSGAYDPRWLPLASKEGAILAGCYVVDPSHSQYAGRLAQDEAASLICRSHGKRGPNLEYLENTVARLKALDMRDRGLERLLARCHALARA